MVAQLDGNMRLSPNISFRGSTKLLKDVTPKYKEQNEQLKSELENIKYDHHNNRLLFCIKSRQRVKFWSEGQVPILGRFLQLVPTAESTDDPEAEVVTLDEYEFAASNPQGDFSAPDLWILFGGHLRLNVVDIDRWGQEQDGTNDPTRWRITVRSSKSPQILMDNKVIGWEQQLVWIHHTRLHLLPPCSVCGDNNHPPSVCAGRDEKRVKPKPYGVFGPRYDVTSDVALLSGILAQKDEAKLASWAKDVTFRLENVAGMTAEDHPAPESDTATKAVAAVAKRPHLLTLDDYANIPLLHRRPKPRDGNYASLHATLRKMPLIEQKFARKEALFLSAQAKLCKLDVVAIIRRLRMAYATNSTFSAYHDSHRWQEPAERARLAELRQTTLDATAAAAFVKKAIPASIRAQFARAKHGTTEEPPGRESKEEMTQVDPAAPAHQRLQGVEDEVNDPGDATRAISSTLASLQHSEVQPTDQLDVSMQTERPVVTKVERAKQRASELKDTRRQPDHSLATSVQRVDSRATTKTKRTSPKKATNFSILTRNSSPTRLSEPPLPPITLPLIETTPAPASPPSTAEPDYRLPSPTTSEDCDDHAGGTVVNGTTGHETEKEPHRQTAPLVIEILDPDESQRHNSTEVLSPDPAPSTKLVGSGQRQRRQSMSGTRRVASLKSPKSPRKKTVEKHAPYDQRERAEPVDADAAPPNFQLLEPARPARPPPKQTTLTQFCAVVDMKTVALQAIPNNDVEASCNGVHSGLHLVWTT